MTATAIALFVAVVLSALADLYTTKRAVFDNPSVFHEANPLMAWLLLRLGPVGLVTAKIVVVALIGWALYAFPSLPVYVGAGIGVAAWDWATWRNKRLIGRKR